MLSFGAKVVGKVDMGLNVKTIFNNIEKYTAKGIAGDIGLLYNWSDKMAFSVFLNNIFGKYSWDGLTSSSPSFEESLPNINSLAFKYNFPFNFNLIQNSNENSDLDLTVSDIIFFTRIDHMKPDNLSLFRIRSGLEIERSMKVGVSDYRYALRFGLIQNRGVENFDIKFLLGLGLKTQRLRFDYCIDFGKENEGISNLFSISFIK